MYLEEQLGGNQVTIINVLTDAFNGDNNIDTPATSMSSKAAPNGTNSDGSGSGFATVLSKSVNSNIKQKQDGQKGRDISKKEKQNDGKPVQDPSALDSTLGYLGFPFFVQMLQNAPSNQPEGSNGNSELNLGQGNSPPVVSSLMNSLNSSAGLNQKLSSALTEQVSPVSNSDFLTSEMMAKAQSNNPGEIDFSQYRKVIGELLQALSGKVTDVSAEGNISSLQGYEANNLSNLRQEMAKIIQGWSTNNGVINSQVSTDFGSDGLTTSDGDMTSSQMNSQMSVQTTELNNLSQEIEKMIANWLANENSNGNGNSGGNANQSFGTLANTNSDPLAEGNAVSSQIKSQNMQTPGLNNLSQEIEKMIANWLANGNSNGNGNNSENTNESAATLVNTTSSALSTEGNMISSQMSLQTPGLNNLSQDIEKMIANWLANGNNNENGNNSGNTNESAATLVNTTSSALSTEGNMISSQMSLQTPGLNNLSQEIEKMIANWLANGITNKNNNSNQNDKQSFGTLVNTSLASSAGTETSEINTKETAAAIGRINKNFDTPPVPKEVSDGLTVTSNEDLTPGISANAELSALNSQKNKSLNIFQSIPVKESLKVNDGQNSQLNGLTGMQNLLNLNMQNANNIAAATAADEKMPTPTIPVWQQIMTALQTQLTGKSQNIKQLDIQLHPENLGKIQIDLRWDNGQVHLQVQAAEASTGQMLQNHLSDLRQSLSNQGVNCGTLQMSQGGTQQQNSQGQDSQKMSHQKTSADKDESLIPEIGSFVIDPIGTNQVNVTA
jgi:flagellar hook-length control protein FliK